MPEPTVSTTRPAPPAPTRTTQAPPRRGRYIVQVATFSSKTNAIRAADDLAGFVVTAGGYYRTRLGPFVSRGEADAALAKARNAGYRDAFVDTSG